MICRSGSRPNDSVHRIQVFAGAVVSEPVNLVLPSIRLHSIRRVWLSWNRRWSLSTALFRDGNSATLRLRKSRITVFCKNTPDKIGSIPEISWLRNIPAGTSAKSSAFNEKRAAVARARGFRNALFAAERKSGLTKDCERLRTSSRRGKMRSPPADRSHTISSCNPVCSSAPHHPRKR